MRTTTDVNENADAGYRPRTGAELRQQAAALREQADELEARATTLEETAERKAWDTEEVRKGLVKAAAGGDVAAARALHDLDFI